ncbi:DUF2235 domain-containing protein [Mycobacterium sp. 155]|uniref:phospholipase effector Tle1 domain-containing protein n=1 Tax=Mycobacterium sp. 155 TaxID=1157943 RepID=UPI000376C341|nr:DUF2235 domain-containing protein [Mycobacterium sp. 155]
MKNIVLCFDHTDQRPGPRDATNTEALFRLLDIDHDQLGWYHSGATSVRATRFPRRRRGAAVADARDALLEAYRFLGDCWEPGDAIYLFGGADGGDRARELAALLGSVGLLPERSDDLVTYALATYALPRTARTRQDWEHVNRLAAELIGDSESTVPVRFLGLWDAVRTPGARHRTGPLTNVKTGRHAMAIDALRPAAAGDHGAMDEVWFRGGHCDIAGGTGACWALAEIAMDWILSGAAEAGLRVSERLSSPNELDALAGTAPAFGIVHPQLDAPVHASVELYLRAHPHYWRRLPARIEWADSDWLARGERLMSAPAQAEPVVPEVLAAAAS